MAVLETVPDPEIPVLTITDLGIVRGIDDDPPRVRISPTYTGCPATVAIEMMIREALDKAGFGDVHIERVLFPPWTTDWITRARPPAAEGLRDRPARAPRRRPNARNAARPTPRKSAASARPRARRNGAANPAWSRSNDSSATEAAGALIPDADFAGPHHSAKLPSLVRQIGLRQRWRSLSASRTAASSISTPRPGPSGTGR